MCAHKKRIRAEYLCKPGTYVPKVTTSVSEYNTASGVCSTVVLTCRYLETVVAWFQWRLGPDKKWPSSSQTPTYSPPRKPMLGCSLADKMTSTIPMMNHSFRIVAKRPMFKSRGSPDHPAGPRQTTLPKFYNSSASPPEVFLSQNTSRASGATSGHMGHSKP